MAFATVFVAIRFPGVQTRIVQRVAEYFSDRLNHEVTIGGVDISFFSNVVLEDVTVKDYRGNELFHIGKADAEIETWSVFNPNTLAIGTLTLEEPRASLVVYEKTDSLNISRFISALGDLFVKKDTTKPSQPFYFTLDELVLKNGRFIYDDFRKAPAAEGMDYAHMTFANINGRFSDLQLEDTLKATVTNLSTVETRSNTKLHNLDTRMTYAPTFWEWDQLDLQVNDSNLKDYVRFDYEEFGNFTEYNDSVTMTVRLQDSKVYFKDIVVFAPQIKEYSDETILVNSVDFKGKVKNFTATDVDLEYGNDTRIIGSVSADGLPNFKETFANMRLKSSTINARDIKQFLPQDAYEIAARLGTVRLDGRFLGFYNDFVSNGNFSTALGSLQSDINLKIDDNTRQSSYSGFLKTNSFNLGRLLAIEDKIRTISMSGRLEGSGFTLNDANITMDATIDQVQVLDYNYRNIKADGTLSGQTFVGKVSVNDPNLVFSANGEVDLEKEEQAFNLLANLQRVDLQALGLSDVPFSIRANADLNFSGLKLDAFVGNARLDSAFISYKGKELALDTISIDSEIVNGTRSLNLNSDLLALKVNGDFDYTTLIEDLKTLVHEYELNFESNDAATRAYYARKLRQPSEDYALNYNIKLKDPQPLLNLFVPDLTISSATNIEGSFRHENTVILTLYSSVDTLLYKDYELYGNAIELNTSKIQYNPDVLAAALFTSQRQVLPAAGETKDFYLEGIWSERNIDFSTSIRQPEQNNRATITGDLNFLQDQIQIVFDRSNITLQQNAWAFNPGNTLYISEGGKKLVFENFSISNKDQIIRAEGEISESPDSRLVVNVDEFDLRNLNPLLTMPIAGRLTGQVVTQDVYQDMKFDGSMRVDSFYLDEVYIGNVLGKTNWNNRLQQAIVDLGIERNNKKVLTVTGNYNPKAEDDQLDLLAVLDQANLKLVEPVLKGIMSDLEGEMEGRVRVLGRLDYPVLKGSVMVTKGQFTFDYLNTTYTFSDRIYLDANSISFRNAQLRDIFGNRATVSGGIAHDGFQDMVLDIEARYRNFMILNTTEAQNELFYGTAFASGSASVLGPTDNLQVKVDATSNENTRIVLPLDYQTDVARKDFIRFVEKAGADTTGMGVNVEDRRVDLSGINLDFNLDVTDDAYFEIIIDRTTGDVIRGTGNGDIRMTIDTRGEFNMYGTFEITNGAYNLNLLEGLVSREFKIVPGGTITWNGDPTAGIMNITAEYTQMVSLEPLNQAYSGRREPVTVEIELTGPLLTPQVNLDLRAELSDEFLLSGINNDEAELNRQVFSLLVLQRLTPPGSLALDSGVGASAVGGSLGSLLSGQLNSFFNSLDSNLEIDIGLSGVTQESLSTLQLRLSYTFFQGRLRVTNQTGFGNNNDANGANASNNYIGDWFLEYYITQSGELRLRLEYSTTPRTYFDNRTSVSSRQRLSLLHTKRFDTLEELFGSNRRERKLREREQQRERLILDSDPRLNL
ncbi:translocation/assembly module TamB domain-containing protein [Pontibacter sp. SD6]|uniref:Translocation/assembly module TamB domain-containing protein n=1 Tax=Pontibacter cellulosilyticus TaxID=1720253 RepID=A0A923SME1_9BACT|nr:translocation/assembly module TamB domain-containing protein [Pontibacter cellulosilyticus]MBC5992095.1 translocation/assembly module TamB domain-containing protein [Pontibacter cellulosilyticus]